MYVHVAPSGRADSPVVVAMNSPTVSATVTDRADINVSAEKPPETRPEHEELMLADVDGGEMEGAGGEVERGGGGERVMEGAEDGEEGGGEERVDEGAEEVGEVKLDSGGITDTQNGTVEQVHVHVYISRIVMYCRHNVHSEVLKTKSLNVHTCIY